MLGPGNFLFFEFAHLLNLNLKKKNPDEMTSLILLQAVNMT